VDEKWNPQKKRVEHGIPLPHIVSNDHFVAWNASQATKPIRWFVRWESILARQWVVHRPNKMGHGKARPVMPALMDNASTA
jgi:hypothetical protein